MSITGNWRKQMNKQEAIRELMSKSREIIFGDDENVYLSRKRTIELVSQIEEPQKPVVPKFVAEWVDNSREHSFDFDEWLDYKNQPLKVYNWLNPENKRQAELNVLALITLIVNGANAVEIEQEKLYTVEIPDPHGMYKIRYLFRNITGNICIGATNYGDIFLDEDTHLTEAEIKKDFDFLWQLAKPVEEN